MKRKTKIIIALILPGILLAYFAVFAGLYFFEPAINKEPDLSQSEFSFDLYSNFSASKDDTFYIKQISYKDVVAAGRDTRLKYVDNTAILIAVDNTSYSDIELLAKSYDAAICGYIEAADFYQFSFSDLNYSELLNICADISSSDLIKTAMPDYFEETPDSSYSSANTDLFVDAYYYDMINVYDAWEYSENIENISIGMIDIPVNYLNSNLSVVNSGEYSGYCTINTLDDTFNSHGTHVAGIIAAAKESDTPGVCPGADIYSYSGINNSLSYWIASLADIITRQSIKAINISMGYNSDVTVSASLGCESTIQYLNTENGFFSAFLGKLVPDYEFLICVAAGNDSGTSLYKINSGFFSYGEKEKLRRLDVLGLFLSKPEYCEAKYSLFLTGIEDAAVRDRIMVVGSCGENYNYTYFSNAGNAVDIAAPGEYIYSTVSDNSYGYLSGTSMATPYVTGAAALLFAIDDSLTAKEVKDILISSGTDTVSAYGFTYPVLNIGNAVRIIANNE